MWLFRESTMSVALSSIGYRRLAVEDAEAGEADPRQTNGPRYLDQWQVVGVLRKPIEHDLGACRFRDVQERIDRCLLDDVKELERVAVALEAHGPYQTTRDLLHPDADHLPVGVADAQSKAVVPNPMRISRG